MKKISLLFIILLMAADSGLNAQTKGFDKERKEINTMLDAFNMAAAKADYRKYFDFFADESTFAGTDAAEVWNKKEFMTWAKPHFDRKKTWRFTSLKRNVYFSRDGKLAWFDELLDTQMKICRGSGVVEKINGTWMLKQYILSMTVPNEVVDKVVAEKSALEDVILKKLKNGK